MVVKLPTPFHWAVKLVGKAFSYKDLELEDDPVFRDRNPSNLFIISTIVSYDSGRKAFIPATIRCSNRSLHFVATYEFGKN